MLDSGGLARFDRYIRPPVALPETPRARVVDSLARCCGRPDIARWVVHHHPDRASVAGEDLRSAGFLAAVVERASVPQIGAGLARWLGRDTWNKLLTEAGYTGPTATP